MKLSTKTSVYIVLNRGQLVTHGAERDHDDGPGPTGGDQGRQYQGGGRSAGVRAGQGQVKHFWVVYSVINCLFYFRIIKLFNS